MNKPRVGRKELLELARQLGVDINDPEAQQEIFVLETEVDNIDDPVLRERIEQIQEMYGNDNRYWVWYHTGLKPENFPVEGLTGGKLLQWFPGIYDILHPEWKEDFHLWVFGTLDQLLATWYVVMGGAIDFRARHPVPPEHKKLRVVGLV